MVSEEYRRGFEDAIELCLKIISSYDDKSKIKRKLFVVLGRVKEDKIEKIEEQLGI